MTTSLRLHDFNTIVTGGSGGIGFAIAEAFAREGANVWLLARDAEKLESARHTLQAYNGTVMTTACDLSDLDAIPGVVSGITEKWEKIDTLVNNAGFARYTPFADTPREEIDMQVNLNLLAPYLLTQQLLPALIASRGSVINISSSSAQRLVPGRPASVYAMTKGAINTLTKALALELGAQGVRVNAIAPGTVRTALTQKMIDGFSEERKKEYQKFVSQSFALGNIGKPEDVGGIAVYLASTEASWVTGSVINIDGGFTTN